MQSNDDERCRSDWSTRLTPKLKRLSWLLIAPISTEKLEFCRTSSCWVAFGCIFWCGHSTACPFFANGPSPRSVLELPGIVEHQQARGSHVAYTLLTYKCKIREKVLDSTFVWLYKAYRPIKTCNLLLLEAPKWRSRKTLEICSKCVDTRGRWVRDVDDFIKDSRAYFRSLVTLRCKI